MAKSVGPCGSQPGVAAKPGARGPVALNSSAITWKARLRVRVRVRVRVMVRVTVRVRVSVSVRVRVRVKATWKARLSAKGSFDVCSPLSCSHTSLRDVGEI